MNYNKLEYFVSQQRLDRFLNVCGNSKVKAQKLYRINLRIAQAAYPILSLFEIFFRNAVYNHVSAYFVDPNWILHEKTGFMAHPSLKRSNFYLKKCIQNAETSMIRKGRVVTTGHVLAEQTFGFWTSLFEPHHYKLIGGSPIKCFVNKPPTINRSAIAIKLDSIRAFRNRIYHNEPICFLNNTIDFTHVENIIQSIYELTDWMDQDLKEYIEYFDNVKTKIKDGKGL
ncbi:hypothetical protein N180_19865 [Pedobacter antarcticus 4BY]|uniref:CAAX protease n=2 Tax=Pedobacter antarcticus TaxID=34086 RepID=A0A081PGS6_9SPHI|nr:Abi family protein [Pedobacter antarcticus]KEQ29899.1 hypothetical protein N180_19865 [Pedobacter antarcticus 4BY]SFF43811.1 Abi-like protein [Pedobacter antarcticus]